MIQSINSYQLDTDVATYGSLLLPFGRQGYEWAKMYGRPRLFEGEEYYWAEDRNFLGRECQQAMVAAVHGRIYKISYRFNDTEPDTCVALRKQAYSFICSTLGEPTEIHEVEESHRVIMWQTEWGNVVLDFEDLDTEVVLTSSSIRKEKRLSFLARLLGKK